MLGEMRWLRLGEKHWGWGVLRFWKGHLNPTHFTGFQTKQNKKNPCFYLKYMTSFLWFIFYHKASKLYKMPDLIWNTSFARPASSHSFKSWGESDCPQIRGASPIGKPIVNTAKQHKLIHAGLKQGRGCTCQPSSRLEGWALESERAAFTSQPSCLLALCHGCTSWPLVFHLLAYLLSEVGEGHTFQGLPWYLKKEGQTMP